MTFRSKNNHYIMFRLERKIELQNLMKPFFNKKLYHPSFFFFLFFFFHYTCLLYLSEYQLTTNFLISRNYLGQVGNCQGRVNTLLLQNWLRFTSTGVNLLYIGPVALSPFQKDGILTGGVEVRNLTYRSYQSIPDLPVFTRITHITQLYHISTTGNRTRPTCIIGKNTNH